jgi:GT2 family glycosyltransferase
VNSAPSIAVVILNWNGISLFSQFLPSVLTHSREEGVTIYVADNGSTDGSVDFLRKNFPSVCLISLDRNYGFAGGYNRALKQIQADYYILLNSDVEVTPDWIIPCIKRLEEEPDAAAVQPKIRSFTDRNKFEYAGAAGGFIDYLGFPFCRGRILVELEEDNGQYDQPASLFWATGACMFIRSGLFHASGGFDEDFFAHMEEIDLCWRLKNQGWKIVFEPNSVVFHLGGATLSYQSPEKVFLNFRNSLWMMVKNLPKRQLLSRLIPRMVLDGVAAVHFLLTGEVKAFKSVLRAHRDFYITLPEFLRKRKDLVKLVRQNRHPEMFRGSMVYRFYVLKYRKFSQFRF